MLPHELPLCFRSVLPAQEHQLIGSVPVSVGWSGHWLAGPNVSEAASAACVMQTRPNEENVIRSPVFRETLLQQILFRVHQAVRPVRDRRRLWDMNAVWQRQPTAKGRLDVIKKRGCRPGRQLVGSALPCLVIKAVRPGEHVESGLTLRVERVDPPPAHSVQFAPLPQRRILSGCMNAMRFRRSIQPRRGCQKA
jgi:hypothetical protein